MNHQAIDVAELTAACRYAIVNEYARQQHNGYDEIDFDGIANAVVVVLRRLDDTDE